MDPPGCARVLGVCEGRPGSVSGRSLTSICCSAVSLSGVLRTHHLTGAQQKRKSVRRNRPALRSAGVKCSPRRLAPQMNHARRLIRDLRRHGWREDLFRERALRRTLCLLSVPGLALAQEPANAQQLEPDHLYIWVSEGAPEGAALRELGILQYPDTVDNGEGVEQITFQLENVFLELLWVSDEELFLEHWASWHPAHVERSNWRTTGASPFALAFHRVDPDDERIPPPFQVDSWWDSAGGYVSDVTAMMPFLMLMGPRYAMPDPSWLTEEGRALADNPAGIRSLTSWTLGTPQPLSNDGIDFLVDQEVLSVRPSGQHVLELTFDDGRQGRTFDARPRLPLVIRY
jgi:hypothetical protein